MKTAISLAVLVWLGCSAVRADVVPQELDEAARMRLKSQLAELRHQLTATLIDNTDGVPASASAQAAAMVAEIDRLDASMPIGLPPTPEKGTNGGPVATTTPRMMILGVPAR